MNFRICTYCGRRYMPRNPVQKFCCAGHRTSYSRPRRREEYREAVEQRKAELQQENNTGETCE